MNIFSLLHYVSKTTEKVLAPVEDNSFPKKEWKTVYIKTYQRFKAVTLPTPKEIEDPLSEVLMKRTSGRNFDSIISLEKLSSILRFSVGSKNLNSTNEEKEERVYPSAGRLFPIETYLFIFKPIESLGVGIYHYLPTNNTLTLIKKELFDEKTMETIVMYDFARNAKCAVLFTSVFDRVVPKYEERGYRFALIEAGCMSHNITLAATALEVESVHMGGIIDNHAEELLGIDGSNESLVHSVFLG